jgi:hypothetical protein
MLNTDSARLVLLDLGLPEAGPCHGAAACAPTGTSTAGCAAAAPPVLSVREAPRPTAVTHPRENAARAIPGFRAADRA